MKLLISILSILSFYSCSQTSDQNVESETLVSVNEIHNHNQNETLSLNENKKWVVVKDMMVYIKYMKSDVNTFKGTTLEDYENLSTDLLINIDLLTANCSMKGNSHDQLHLWLLPYIAKVNNFAKTETVENSKIEYEKIKELFKEFDNFFE